MKRLFALIALLSLHSAALAQTIAPAWDRALYGSVPGVLAVTISGYNGTPTTTYENVWPESGAYSFRTSAMSTPYCASSSANDTSAGTGARTIRVSGVDTSFAAFSETVTLNGQTSVNLATANVLGINSVAVLTAGSGLLNAGIVRCGTGTNTSGVPAVVEAHVAAGLNETQSAIYTVPANYTLICDGISVATKHATAANTYDLVLDTFVNLGLRTRKQVGYLAAGGGNPSFYPFKLKFPEKTQLSILTLAATATDPVFASMNCLLIEAFASNQLQRVF